MGWCTTSDLDRFVEASASYLKPRAAENSTLLSAAEAAVSAADGLLFGWWQPPDGSCPRGAFLHDPATPLLIAGRAPELAAALAATLARAGRQLCGVDAPVEAADAFAAAWSQRSGLAVRVHQHSCVYRLARDSGAAAGLSFPAGPQEPSDPAGLAGQRGPAGQLRVAGPADRDLLIELLAAFAAESGERSGSPDALADELISYGGAVFWEAPQRTSRIKEAAQYLAGPRNRDAAHRAEQPLVPVALAAITRPVAGTVRISLIYTLPERRRSGYAAALTRAVSHAVLAGDDRAADPGQAPSQPGCLALARAEQVVLITDRNQPGWRVAGLGFQLVGERIVLRFGAPTSPLPKLRSGPMPRLPTGPLPRLRRGR